MSVVTWVCQVLLGAVFVWSGVHKSVQSKQRMIETGQTGVQAYSLPFIRFIAAAELLGALGLILPAALHVAPLLTPLAAGGLAVIMLGAGYSHWKLGEPRNVAVNVVLLAMCLIVVLERGFRA